MLQLLAQSSDYLYETTTTTTTDADAAGAAAFMGVFIIPILIYLVVSVIGMWKLFEKAGKPGWAAIVPIYNYVVLLQIAEKPVWWLAVFLLSWIPVIGSLAVLAFSVLVGIAIAEKFGKSAVWGAILNGLLGIGYLILGFDSSKYQGATEVANPGVTSTPATPVAPVESTDQTPPTTTV